MEDLAVSVMLGTTFIDRHIKRVFCMHQKIIHIYSRAVPMSFMQSYTASLAKITMVPARDGENERAAILLLLVAEKVTIPANTKSLMVK